MNDELIKAVKSLLNDIEAMRCVPQYTEDNDSWFGPFSESEDCGDDGQSVEWPNLAILAAKVKELLDGPVVAGSLAAPQLSHEELVKKGLVPRFKVGDYVTGYAVAFGTVSGAIIKVDREDRNQFYQIMHNDWPIWLENHTVELAVRPENGA